MVMTMSALKKALGAGTPKADVENSVKDSTPSLYTRMLGLRDKLGHLHDTKKLQAANATMRGDYLNSEHLRYRADAYNEAMMMLDAQLSEWAKENEEEHAHG